jgi:pentatricopeptide repeat protein
MKRKGVDEAWNALEEMQQKGQATDKYTVSRMLMKTVGDGRSRFNPARVYRVISLVEKFIEMQPTDVDEVLLNALLDTCCRLKDLNRLEALMQRMRDLKITPSPVTLGILVKTYGQAGNIEKVLQVWDEMDKQRIQANAVTYGCMIDACVKCNRLDRAKEIFQGMRETGKHRNTILYTTLIKGFGLEKDLAGALHLFREMPQEGVPYNTITYNSIIDACVKTGDLMTAESLLHEIAGPNSAVEPDLITFSTLLKGYCNIGDLDKALQVAEAIKARGLCCDELVYNTLMDGCVKANDVTAGVGLFEEMVQAGMRPSAITHSILARLYQRAGYEEDALDAVAQLYQHHGIERPTGGDRMRGSRRGAHQRSPLGRGARSPTASPTAGSWYQERHDWNMWGDVQSASGFDGYHDQSCASTPCGSPGHSMGNNGGNGLFLPLDAMRGMPPPLPGMGSDGTPYASSCAGLTPMSNTFQGSFAGSPGMSPTSMEQHGQSYNNAAPVAGITSLPPFPFPGGTIGNTMGSCTMPGVMSHGSAPSVESQAAQFFPAQMPQPAPIPTMMQAVNSIMVAPGSMLGPQGTGPGEAVQHQQNAFSMPVSAPHDFGMCSTQQSQPAFFESFSHDGQIMNATGPCAGLQNPF